MKTLAGNTVATITPCLAYRDAPAAIEWLCATFGFERRAVHVSDDGKVLHAELTFGNGMIMLGSVMDSAFGQLLRQPDETQGRVTQTICVVVTDPDELHRRAVAAGAKILMGLRDEDYGSRGFTCTDPEGHVWTLATYDPWRSAS